MPATVALLGYIGGQQVTEGDVDSLQSMFSKFFLGLSSPQTPRRVIVRLLIIRMLIESVKK